MKKILLPLVVAFALSLALCACSSSGEDKAETKEAPKAEETVAESNENVFEYDSPKVILDDDKAKVTITKVVRETYDDENGEECAFFTIKGEIENKTEDRDILVDMDNLVTNGYTIGYGTGAEAQPGTKAKADFYLSVGDDIIDDISCFKDLSGDVGVAEFDKDDPEHLESLGYYLTAFSTAA